MSGSVYEDVTAAVVRALEGGTVPWRKPWGEAAGLPRNAASGRAYRGVNLLLLGISPYADNRWLTFRQALGLGGSVRKGERATPVVFWTRWTPGGPEPEPPEDGGPGVAPREVPVLRRYSVFNAEQCEGLGIPPLYIPKALPEHRRIERAELLARSMPDPPLFRESGSSAWYSVAEDLVQVPPLAAFRSPDAYYATRFHEMGHATGHAKRLARSDLTGGAGYGAREYGREELVAELASAFCCAVLGLDNSLLENSAAYVASWLSLFRDDPKVLVVAAARAQRAADLIRGVLYDA